MPVVTGDAAGVRRAVEALREGGLVGMPTETVYGLACNAMDPRAVARVYEAKGRPAHHPLIVHVASVASAERLAGEWPREAAALAAEFWPGPLTLVVPRGPEIPPSVAGGLPTLALRVPRHPVALALLAESGLPLAAPSANRWGRLSPTTSEAVLEAMGDPGFLVLEGGPCEVGIESTVLALGGGPPRVLRPGQVGIPALEAVLGEAVVPASEGAPVESPGMSPRHYAPSRPVVLVARLGPEDAGLGFHPPASPRQIEMPGDPARYAALLYASLRAVDRLAPERIAVELVPGGDEWAAVRDRLARASHA